MTDLNSTIVERIQKVQSKAKINIGSNLETYIYTIDLTSPLQMGQEEDLSNQASIH